MTADLKPLYSVIFPTYNEEANVPLLYQRLVPVMEQMGKPFEIIICNDASTDRTREIWLEIMRGDKRCRMVTHRTNLGESAGNLTGMWSARGEYVITSDADLQNPPEEIPKLLAKVPEYDCVAGYRVARHDVWQKKIGSRIANGIRNGLTHDNVIDTGCGLKVFKKSCVYCIPPWKGVHRFLATTVRFCGYKVAQVGVQDAERHSGVSKYGHLGAKRIQQTIPDVIAMRRLIAYERCHLDAVRGDFMYGPCVRSLPQYVEPETARPLNNPRPAEMIRDSYLQRWLETRYLPIRFFEETV